MNKVYLIGNLAGDVDLRYTPSGMAVAAFRMGTTSYSKSRGESTQWHNIKVLSKSAEISAESMAKGDPVFVEGELQTREYTDKQGQKRWFTEVLANTVRKIARKEKPPSQQGFEMPGMDVEPSEPFQTIVPQADFSEEDIPF